MYGSTGRAVVVTPASASAFELDDLVKALYGIGKALSGELSCTWTGVAFRAAKRFALHSEDSRDYNKSTSVGVLI